MGNIERNTMRKVLWRFLPLLIVCFITSFLDRVNVGFAALEMNKDLGFSSTVFGLGAGLFFVGYVLFEIPSNILLERFGARRWIARIMATWGLLSGAMALVQGPWSFYVLRVLLGIAEAGFFPGIMLFFTLWLPSAYRGRVVSYFMAAMPFANVVGSLINGRLMSLTSVAGLRNWQFMFLIEALPAVVLAGLVLIVLRDRPAQAEWLSEDERSWLVGTLSMEKGSASTNPRPRLSSIVRNPIVIGLALVYFGLNAFNFGLSFFLPQIVVQFHLGAAKVGVLSAVPMLAAGLVMILWGRHSDKSGERRLHLTVPMALAIVGLCGSTFAVSAAYQLFFLSLASIGAFCALPIFWTVAPTALGEGAAAVGFAAINSFGNLAGFGAPFLVGYLKDLTGSTAAGMQAISLYGCVALGTAIVVTRVTRKPAHSETKINPATNSKIS